MAPLVTSKKRYREFRKLVRRGGKALFADIEERDGAPKKEELSPQESRRRRWRYLRDYLRWLRPYRWPLVGLLVLATVAMGFEMAQPLAFGWIIDRVLQNDALTPRDKRQLLFWVCAGVAVLLLAARVVSSLRYWWMIRLNLHLARHLRQTLMDHCLRLPLLELTNLKAGGIVSRLSNNVDQATGLIQMALVSPATATIHIAAVMVVLFWLDWRLALAACAMIPPLVLISGAWVMRVRPIYRSASKDANQADARATETFGGVRVVRAFRREVKEERDYGVNQHTILRKRLLGSTLEMSIDVVWELLIPATALAILWLGGSLVIRDQAQGAANPVTVGQIVTFSMYVGMLMSPVLRIVFSISHTQQSLAAMERVFDLLHKPQDKPDRSDAATAPRAVREIRFDHVWFEYRPDLPVVCDFDLRVPGGSTVALVGPSGAGKTTITDLLARFHDPTRGAITLNGADLRALKLESYRRLLAVVEQEVFLFDGSVRENIAYGYRDADDARVRAAALRANAHGFISELPEGYGTIIGERGVKLSGGQRQRLSIARALLADPQILILDEATSNLDTESEQLIQSALRELYAHRTTFVIAHRLSTVTHANLIVVMDDGRIVETGRHADLMAAEGKYYQMVERQRQFAGRDPAAIA